MSAVRRFPGPAAAVPIGHLVCCECGASPMIFHPGQRAGVPHVWAYCGPLCAAGAGVEPWASADLADRMTWRDRGELEAADAAVAFAGLEAPQ